MTSIDPSAQLAALIRSQLAPLGRPSRGAASKGARNSVEIPNRGKPGRDDVANIIAQRVQSIDPEDEQAERKAFRIFLESVLLIELGADLINDPGFYRMVEDVQNQMEQDEELAPSISQAAKLLLSSRKSPKD